jgi:predicted ATPase/DNA-binding SARP family transcriptional activator/class 3 adenylate cyclase
VAALGPLVLVDDDGTEQSISARLERRVLALLAVRAGSEVSESELMMAVYGEDQPSSAHKNIQKYVSNLRHRLGHDAIVTGSTGYQLNTAIVDTDIRLFERLIRLSSEAFDAGDMRTSIGHFEAAAAMWRGSPLPELVDHIDGMAESTRLSESYQSALERAFDARLKLGQHTKLIGELEASVAAEPLRERRWQQLMLAYYRSDRQADALRAYQRLHRILGDELGIDPSDQTKTLENAILSQDPALTGSDPDGSNLLAVVSGSNRTDLPSGNVTFLCTEIEDASRLAKQNAGTFPKLVERHREVLGGATSRHGGSVVRHQGDSSLVVFADASHALVACLEAQREFGIEAWPGGLHIGVQIGLDTGIARPDSGGDYASVAVEAASRISNASHGGQILLSADTAHMVRRFLPASSSLVDRGSFLLSGFDEPQHLFQLIHPDLESSFPPLRASPAQSHNLPSRRTPFVGRVEDVESLEELLSDNRLLTIVGPGGAGKTRLSIELAARLVPRFERGVRLCDLSPLNDPDLVPPAVAAALGAPTADDADPVTSLVTTLEGAEVLLVLDSCDHLLAAAGRLCERLLEAIPNLKILTTSREPLAVSEELTWRISPLAVPDAGADLDAVCRSDAVRLFENRASAAQPGFKVSADNASAVTEICTQLEGLPLAIELAAAQVTALAPAAIADRLRGGFPVSGSLSDGRGPARHRTLEATVGWSYQLLDEPARRFLRLLSVFANGFTIDAARAISDEADPVGVLTRLVNKSLVVWDLDAARYRLLETIRTFARTRLDEAGEADVAQSRHLAWCAAFAESLHSGHSQKEAFELFGRELDNFRVALAWAASHNSQEVGQLVEAVREPEFPEPTLSAAPSGETKGWWELRVAPDREFYTRMDAGDIKFPDSVSERTFRLTGELASIGRRGGSRSTRPEIDLSEAPADLGVSHEHALLLRKPDGHWAIVDSGAVNGVFLNESDKPLPVNRITTLADGDRIHIGAWTTMTISYVTAST